jgi:Protein of unknown function (DUF1194)
MSAKGESPNMRWLVAALALLLPSAASAESPEAVDVAIVVALDRSESIDQGEARAEIDGLIYTLTNSRFMRVVASGPHGRIALSVVAWSSFGRSAVLLPWSVVAGPVDCAQAASILALDYERQRTTRYGSQTDVAFAIDLGIKELEHLPWPATQRVINVVADGVSNIGRVATVDRDRAIKRGITVNGLIMGRGSAIEVLSRYFKSEVIGGPSAFMQVSRSNEEFAEAMLRKMLLEMVRLRALPPRSHAG